MHRRLGRKLVVGTVAVMSAMATQAHAATINVDCGNEAALKAAVTQANGTAEADTIEINGAAGCITTLTSPMAPNANGNASGLSITNPLTIDGNGTIVQRSNTAGAFRVVVAVNTALALREVTIQGGLLNLNNNVGAGVATLGGSLTLDRATVRSNVVQGAAATAGGGVWLSGTRLDMVDSTIASNQAPTAAGINMIALGDPSWIRRSNISFNVASNSAGAGWLQGGSLNLENSTVAANTAGNGVGGFVSSNQLNTTNTGNLIVYLTTFINNRRTNLAAPGGTLVRFQQAGGGQATIQVEDSIVADSANVAQTSAPCVGVTNNTGNLEHPGTSCGFGTNGDPKLDLSNPFGQLNGGKTANYKLLPGSAAVGIAGLCLTGTDQRGLTRPQGEACDAGAVEAPSPATQLAPVASPTNAPSLTFTSPHPGATFECKVDNAQTFTACTSPFTPALSDGEHTVAVRAVAEGFAGPQESATFVVDKTAPTVTLTSVPPATTDDDTPTVEFTASDGTTTCKVDTGDAEPCSSPFTTSELEDGPHTVTVFATDAAGNTGSKSTTFTVDTAPAQTTTVACNDVAALRAAMTAANATLAHDTIALAAKCTYTLTDSVNPASGGNGLPIVTRPLTIEGNGSTITRQSSAPNFRILFVSGTGVDLVLRDLIVSGGKITGQSGAGVASFLGDLVLERAQVNFNLADGTGTGGGIVTIGGTLELTDTLLAFNASNGGGGLATTQTLADVDRSTFYGNGATSTTGGALIQGGEIDITSSTFSLNHAANGIGGLAVGASGAVNGVADVASTTFTDNGRSGNTGVGNALLPFVINATGTATINVTDTIVNDSDSTTLASGFEPCHVLGAGATINQTGGNLEWPRQSCGFGTNANPQLTALAAVNGAFVHRPQPGSAAIDIAGDSCPSVDQRQAARPDGEACDAGSYETPAPQTTATGPDSPTNDPSVTFTSDTGTSFECAIDDAETFTACTSPFEPQLGDGEHTVRVRARDAQGYEDRSPASVTFVVDATPPVVELTSAPPSTTNEDAAAFTWTVSEPAQVTCQLDDRPQEPCSSPYTVGLLPEGHHTFTVRATDAAGNTGSATHTWLYSTGPPETTITGGPSGTIEGETSATFTFTSSKPSSTFECRLDGGAWSVCTSPKTVSGYEPGQHTFEVRAVDAFGVKDPTPASRTFTYKKCTIRITSTLGLPIRICV